ncbi:hypothetical protein GCM10028822_14630 [Hymenobacter terrigena]
MNSDQQTQTQPAVDAATLVRDFKQQYEGKLPAEQLQSATDALMATANATGYAANGNIASMVFYVKVQVNVTGVGGKSFNSNGGGVFTPGGGAYFGTVYTDDINRLYRDTVSFQVTATNVYVSVVFFDGNSKTLGTFQAGAVSTVTGVGGGSGHWA